ncbi:cadherin-23-like [Glandiceps talaboti]
MANSYLDRKKESVRTMVTMVTASGAHKHNSKRHTCSPIPGYLIFVLVYLNDKVEGQGDCTFVDAPTDRTSSYEEQESGTPIYTIDVIGDIGTGTPPTGIQLEIFQCGEGPTPSNECGNLFKIVDKQLQWGRRYDLETETCDDYYVIVFMCTHTGQPTYFEIELIILDKNEYVPVFARTPYNENLIEDAGDDMFEFQSINTPIILLKSPLDYEINQRFSATIRATDCDGTGLNSTTQFYGNIVDGDDMRPIFKNVVYYANITEERNNGTVEIFPHIEAYDQDLGINQSIYYSFEDPHRMDDSIFEMGVFKIDNSTAELSLMQALDREELENGKITVQLRAAQDDSIGYPFYSYRDAQATLVITVLDTNDNAPEMKEAIYYGDIPENSPKGTIVCGVMATDLDEGTNAVFKFVVDSDDSMFSVDDPMSVTPNHAVSFIRVNDSAMLDADLMNGIINITVYAIETETGERSVSGKSLVMINVIDVNDNAPIFLSDNYTASVYENITEETLLTTVEAVDIDQDLNGEIEYSIWSVTDNGADIFEINDTTGDLYASAMFDFLDAEIVDRYVVTVMAKDKGEPPLFSLTNVLINVINVNDEPPKFVDSPYVATISEGAIIDASIFRLEAVDADGDELTFSFQNGRNVSDDRVFSMDAMTGEIRILSLLDREAQDQHNVTVKVGDENPDHIDISYLLIDVTDINDNNPNVTANKLVIDVLEEQEIGNNVTTVSAFDIDEGSNAMFTFKIADSMNENFTVVSDLGTPDEGFVKTASRLDREFQAVYEVYVLAVDEGRSPRTGQVMLTVNLQDVNDNAPQFEQSVYEATAPEGVVGYHVLTVKATDADEEGNNTVIKYAIIEQNNTDYDIFDIEQDTGNLIINTAIKIEDYGTNVTVVLEAYNTREYYFSNIVNGTTTVIVTLQETNATNLYDPYFNSTRYTMSTEENDHTGHVDDVNIGQVFAKDDDIDSDVIEYGILYGNEDNQFNISEDGVITTNGTIDRETKASHSLFIFAEDSGLPPRRGVSLVEIEIEDVNDNLPVFEKPFYNVSVAEGTSGKTIVTVKATDKDIGVNKMTLYAFTDNHDDHTDFNLDSITGDISLRQPIYRNESGVSLDLEVVAYNNVPYVGESTTNNTVMVYVIIEGPCNKEDPYFNHTTHTCSVLENDDDPTTIGTFVCDIKAYDPDTGFLIQNFEIPYGAAGKFNITNEGNITTAGVIDREMQDVYTVMVKGIDDGLPNTRQSVTEVIITILDVNDNKPDFDMTSYSGEIEENADIGSPVLIVPEIMVTDNDTGINSEIYLALSGDGSQYFEVDLESGIFARVTVKNGTSLNRETTQNFTLMIEASNFDNSMTTAVPLIITLLDLNDNAPVFNLNTDIFEVVENETLGHHVAYINASDDDAEDRNNGIQYFFVDGDYGQFAIDRNTGEITVADTLYGNITGRYTYVISVMAYNSGTDRDQETTTTITINIGDYYNVPPFFPEIAYSASIYEDADEGDFVVTVTAIDYNSGSNGELTYSISTQDVVPFEINENTATITVNGSLDREEIDTYQFNVIAIDGGFPALMAMVPVTIDILDINENPQFNRQSYNATVMDQTPPGVYVHILSAVDSDLGDNGTVQYSLSGNGSDYFRVDDITGLIQVNKEIDSTKMLDSGVVDPILVNNNTVYYMVLTAVATDMGAPSLNDYAELIITIIETVYEEPEFNDTAYDSLIKENLASGK